MTSPPVIAPIRAVFDTNVLLQALARPGGPAGACMDAARQARVTLCLSGDLLAELANVASRPSVIAKLHLTDITMSRFLDELRSIGSIVDAVPAVFRHPIDPKDSMVVDLAIAARAHVITSRDQHLLALRDAATTAGADFISRFGSIRVLTPIELLSELRAS